MIIVSLLALLLTGSRGGLIIFGLQMLVLVGSIKKMSRAHSRVAKRILSFIIPGSTVIVLGSSEYITNTLLRRFAEISFNVKGNSSGERLLGLLGGLQIGFENPLFGVGLGNFRNAYPYTSASQNGLVSLESAHNFIINLFAEGGVAAVLIWLLIILLIGKRLRDSRSFLKKTGNYMLYLALFISFWGFVLVTFAFYGEFFHKGSGLPIILYCTVMATISILSRQRHCSRMFGEEMEK
jgi:O-antigen ligase